MEVIEINKTELIEIQEKLETILVDVRETEEFNDFNIGGLNIPSHLLFEKIEILKTIPNLIVVCSNGTRSHIMARVIQKKIPLSQVYHLTEGIG